MRSFAIKRFATNLSLASMLLTGAAATYDFNLFAQTQPTESRTQTALNLKDILSLFVEVAAESEGAIQAKDGKFYKQGVFAFDSDRGIPVSTTTQDLINEGFYKQDQTIRIAKGDKANQDKDEYWLYGQLNQYNVTLPPELFDQSQKYNIQPDFNTLATVEDDESFQLWLELHKQKIEAAKRESDLSIKETNLKNALQNASNNASNNVRTQVFLDETKIYNLKEIQKENNSISFELGGKKYSFTRIQYDDSLFVKDPRVISVELEFMGQKHYRLITPNEHQAIMAYLEFMKDRDSQLKKVLEEFKSAGVDTWKQEQYDLAAKHGQKMSRFQMANDGQTNQTQYTFLNLRNGQYLVMINGEPATQDQFNDVIALYSTPENRSGLKQSVITWLETNPAYDLTLYNDYHDRVTRPPELTGGTPARNNSQSGAAPSSSGAQGAGGPTDGAGHLSIKPVDRPSSAASGGASMGGMPQPNSGGNISFATAPGMGMGNGAFSNSSFSLNITGFQLSKDGQLFRVTQNILGRKTQVAFFDPETGKETYRYLSQDAIKALRDGAQDISSGSQFVIAGGQNTSNSSSQSTLRPAPGAQDQTATDQAYKIVASLLDPTGNVIRSWEQVAGTNLSQAQQNFEKIEKSLNPRQSEDKQQSEKLR